MAAKITPEMFLRDVETHAMTVFTDSDRFRHIRFKKPESGQHWFDLVTWPGALCICGDMGTWVFRRVPDMFTFFRRDDLQINPSYWAEKVEAGDVTIGPAKKFDPETFKASVLMSIENYELEPSAKATIIEELESEVFSQEQEFPARTALTDFECGEFHFQDAWEITGQTWTYHFLWCLYAIVWGIQQYDKAPASLAGGGNAG